MAIILYSNCCTEGFRYQGGAWPTICPQCGVACAWKAAPVEEPTAAYALTRPDARFLAALKIDPEVVES